MNYTCNKTFDYNSYRNFVAELAQTNSTTGEATPERVHAIKLNIQRMIRIEKQVVIQHNLAEVVKKINQEWDWILITEPWCGDGAQLIPIIEKIASLNKNIYLKIILRDENPEWINKHLTNGTRSIPKLICINSTSNKEVGTWGPRPEKISSMVYEFKKNNPEVSHDDFLKNLHLWYARDKGESLQEDFLNIIPEWTKKY